MSKKTTELDALTVIAADDLLALVDWDDVAGSPKKMTVANFVANLPQTPISQGLAGGFENWGFLQSWVPGNPLQDYNGGGFYISTKHDADADRANDIHAMLSQCKIQNPTTIGGYPTTSLSGVSGLASNYGADSQVNKLFGGSFEARQFGEDVSEIYAGMFQASNGSYIEGDTTRITGIYADAYTTPGKSAGSTIAVGTLYGAELRTFGKSNYAADNISITTAYGIYSSVYNQQKPTSTITIGDLYNVYLTPYRPGGYGTNEDGAITNYYGLRIVDPVDLNATNKWSIYSEGTHHFDQPTVDEAVPVVSLDQADLSEGYVDFLGTSAASAVGPISSWTSGNSIQGFVRVEINGASYWMPYYDAPTS